MKEYKVDVVRNNAILGYHLNAESQNGWNLHTAILNPLGSYIVILEREFVEIPPKRGRPTKVKIEGFNAELENTKIEDAVAVEG